MRDLFGIEAPALLPPDGEKGQLERGAFYTPDLLAEQLCLSIDWNVYKLHENGPRSIFEPGCGGGAFLRAAAQTWPEASLYGVDLLPACEGPGTVEQRDLFTVTESFDLVAGNPDFSIAEEVVRHCMKHARKGGYIALLLLSQFEESRKRSLFWRDCPLYLRQAIGAPRPCFKANGETDQRPYSLFVWKQGHSGNYLGLPPLVWREE